MSSRIKLQFERDHLIEESVNRLISLVSNKLKNRCQERTENVSNRLEKVLNAFAKARLNPQHFLSLTGYGHGDQGREIIDSIYADILGAEKAAVRLQFVSGTHAITSALFGILRPGDKLLSVTGRPYETLEEVIGLRGKGKGSLNDFGVIYQEISLNDQGRLDLSLLDKALSSPKKMIFIQRSCGYSWRPSLSIEQIKNLCLFIHQKQPKCICFVDNCYGEFVEELEPTDVGADLIAGSLIKNPGGTIVPTGGYVAGRADLVELACCRLTAPGIGSEGGTGFDLNRLILQGLFLAPQMVSEALIGADLVAGVFQELGFAVNPLPAQQRADVIQAVRIGTPDGLKVVCKAFQECSPVGAYLEPIPSGMPGYSNDLVMAGGTFIDGSTSEFSADAPLKPPYNLFVQGGTHRTHVKLALKKAIFGLVKAGLVELT